MGNLLAGLAATETRLDEGAVNVRVGEGRTAEVLRNLCWRVLNERPDLWEKTVEDIDRLFGSRLKAPVYMQERGEIVMEYQEQGVRLDLSCSGRGLQQTLLILTYMRANPGAIILLDEPDAHLEILRQRQIYALITEVAAEQGNQIIAASHSEVLLNEAADRDTVIAFVGKPHVLGNGRSRVRKALNEIGFDQYYQAEQTGWVLYLEGSTDLAILQAFARRLGNERAIHVLERPFVRYVANQPSKAKHHYYGLREALPALQGLALFDRLDDEPAERGPLQCIFWKKREIENYLCTRETLEAYARASDLATDPAPLFTAAEADRRVGAMREAIAEIEEAMATLGKDSPWSPDAKVSDDFLTPLFKAYFKKLDLPNIMDKKQFHALAGYVPQHEIDAEIGENLDAIAHVVERAASAGSREKG